MFGEWTKNIADLSESFSTAKPYEHVIIPDFFSDEIIKKIHEEFPDVTNPVADWKRYHNPIEFKYTLNNFSSFPEIQGVYEHLQSDEVLGLLRQISGITNLSADPHLHGAGLHVSPRGGKNDLHLDYELHPMTSMERRLNLIVYLNEEWKPEWGGALELWDENLHECVRQVTPEYNTAILFRTSANSYHGFSRPIQCPVDRSRRSLTNYYVSDPCGDLGHKRPKAEFFRHPEQSEDARLDRLRSIRKTRIITEEDLAEWPDWRSCGAGWWI